MFSTVMVRICRSKKCSCPLEPSVGSPTRKGFDRKGTAWWSCSLLRPWCLRVLSRVVKQKAMMIILGMWLDFLKCPSNGTIAVEAITSGFRMGQSHSPSCFETSNHQPQAQIFVAWNTSCIYKEGHLHTSSLCFHHVFFICFSMSFHANSKSCFYTLSLHEETVLHSTLFRIAMDSLSFSTSPWKRCLWHNGLHCCVKQSIHRSNLGIWYRMMPCPHDYVVVRVLGSQV